MGRFRRKQFRMALGRHGVIGLVEARQRARRALELIEQGKDPREEKRRARHAPSEAIEDVVEDFIARHIKRYNRPRTAAENIRALRKRVVPVLRGRGVNDISRRDIIEIIEEIGEKSSANANRTRGAISQFFMWCLDRGIIDASPATNLPTPAPIPKRERVLTNDEIQVVWLAFEKQEIPFAAFYKFLLLTGQRRGEVSTMQWDHIDFDEAIWTIPSELVKSNRTHEVPLSPLAVQILQSLNRSGNYVFTTMPRGNSPISGFSKTKKAIDSAARTITSPWRVHDLRRTCGTGMARLGTPPHTISRVLNHAEGGVTSIYNRYGYLNEKRLALNAWSRHVETLVAQPPNRTGETKRPKSEHDFLII